MTGLNGGRRVVGLTGGIGVGKSTVARLLGARGAVIVDVDAVAKAVIEPGGVGHDALIARFGPGLVVDGRLDRAALGAVVFGDPAALADLTAISHPATNTAMAAEVAAAPEGSVVVLDMAVLAEYPNLGRWAGGGYERVLVVEAPLDVRLDRLEHQRGMARDDAQARIASQSSDEQRRALAHWVVDNGGDLDHLESQVERLWPELTAF